MHEILHMILIYICRSGARIAIAQISTLMLRAFNVAMNESRGTKGFGLAECSRWDIGLVDFEIDSPQFACWPKVSWTSSNRKKNKDFRNSSYTWWWRDSDRAFPHTPVRFLCFKLFWHRLWSPSPSSADQHVPENFLTALLWVYQSALEDLNLADNLFPHAAKKIACYACTSNCYPPFIL